MSDLTFDYDRILYSDPSYFQDTTGGINSVGVGISPLSGNLGWIWSPQRLLKQKVTKRSTTLRQLCTTNEAVIIGYITFAQGAHDTLFKDIKTNIYMDGTDWVPAVCCAMRPRSVNDFTNEPWSIVCFRADGFALERDWFDQMSQPINIFGDIWPVPMNGQNCFMKARGAAIIVSQ